MHTNSPRTLTLLAVAALAVTASCAPTVPDTGPEGELLGRVAAVLSNDDLSESLWPGWEVSLMPVAVYREGETCYVVRHPLLPPSFSRSHGDFQIRDTVYEGKAGDASIDTASGELSGITTVILDASEASELETGGILCAAFRAHEAEFCPDRPDPPTLMAGYPILPHQLAMADIECEALQNAVAASPESLEVRLMEFVSLRSFRRMDMMRRCVEYERCLEFEEGLAGYVSLRCKTLRESSGPGSGRAASEEERLSAALEAGDDLEWYRRTRFRHTGAAICALLDRYYPEWKADVERRCEGPYEILRRLFRGRVPLPAPLLARYDYQARRAERESYVESQKTDAERAYESIINAAGPMVVINTKLLSSASVSYDPENMLTVDARREVHNRVIKIECSGGTHIHISGRPVAVGLGTGAFDLEQLIFSAPEDLTIVCDGDSLNGVHGVYNAQRSMVIKGEGVSVEAASGIAVVGESRTTLVLHR